MNINKVKNFKEKIRISIYLVVIFGIIFNPIIFGTEDEVIKEEQVENEVVEEQETDENIVIANSEETEEVNETVTEEDIITNTDDVIIPEEIIDEQETEQSFITSEVNVGVNYQGQVWIDSPKNQVTYIVPDTTLVEVTGWAVSNDKAATLRISVDGNLVGNIERTVRNDVNMLISPMYGGVEMTPQAGYKAVIDFTGCINKQYILKVELLANDGAILSTLSQIINIEQKKYQGQVWIDTPINQQTYVIPDYNLVEVTGWAVSDDENATLRISVDGNLVGNIERTVRGDVDTSISLTYGGTNTTPQAGYKAVIDFTGCAQKPYVLKVDLLSRNGIVISTQTNIVNIRQKDYQGQIWIDTPVNQATYKIPEQALVDVAGWAVSNDENATLRISVDGNLVGNIERTSRIDVDTSVSPTYGGTKVTPQAGYKAVINFTDCAEKTYILKVELISRFGKIIASSTQYINIITPYYPSIVCIDNPVKNARYPSGKLVVSGWAVTVGSGDYVLVYVDGVYKIGAARYERSDVLVSYGAQFGLTPDSKPGFYSEIDTTLLPEGTHTLKIVHYSRYNKKIGESEVNFIISNTKWAGIDVSHYNGNIDWNAVRNSGITFAILKIGEYRESSKRILIDSQFETNYAACKRLGIGVGGYFYSYAFNPTEAAHEADACTAIISGKSFELPIFLDLEDSIVTKAVNNSVTNVENLTNAVSTFCDIMISRGYMSGIYSYRNFFYEYLNMTGLEKYNIWVAHYTTQTNYTGKYDIWQYSDTGTVPGINGSVDMNWCYKRYF